jgi:transposase-like protein
MVCQKVKCPFCGSENVGLFGKTKAGIQRYVCHNEECSHRTFQLEYKYNACKPGAHERIVEMAMNGSGTRDTGRALHISKDTVTAVLKKTEKFVVSANENFCPDAKALILRFITHWRLKWTKCGLFAAVRSMKYGSGGL